MTPQLVVTAGPWRGGSLALDAAEAVVGRDPSCALCLPDATLSRRHALLVPVEGGWAVRDLGSLNGIRVNGVPATERLLADGDQVEIGASVLLYRDGREEPGGLAEEANGSIPGGEPTVRLSAERALWAAGAAVAESAGSGDRLATLLSATRRLSAVRTEEALAEELLDAALRAVPASAGALLLSEEGAELRDAGWRRRDGGQRPFPISRTAARGALARREALVWSAEAPDAAPSPESLRGSGARAVAAVPLLSRDEREGILYVVSDAPGAAFSEDDLQLLFGLCASAATALAVVRHVAFLEGERRRLSAPEEAGDGLLGASPAIARVRELVTRSAASDATVLLLGESGTGKELAARALHAQGARRDRPFVAVNAAALVETLAESELFGHEKGAFTGALARRKGKLESAHGGTLFLDEVGEMSPSTQAKLLRVLETREFERVGGSQSVKVDVRLVAATNRDLLSEVKAGRFREDLYYRLAVLAISLPPLRERREDVPALASAFLARQAARLGKRFDGFSKAALARLVSYAWPGNVRELANAVERAAVLSDGGLVRPEDLPEALLEAAAPEAPDGELGPYHQAVNRGKREAVQAALARAGGSVTEAARLLGLHPNYLHRLLNQLGLRSG